MALQSQRLIRFIARQNGSRYHNNSNIFSFPFSTLDIRCINDLNDETPDCKCKNDTILDESRVLDELSDLLPIQRKTPVYNFHAEAFPIKLPETKAADEFLAPEQKLRGIFLQKLRGKTAIEHALTNVGVDLSVDIFAKVVNRGNMSGEAMVIFFKWVIKQPKIPKEIGSYNIILKALGRRKFFKHMVDVLRDMNEQGISPNSDTLSIVMDSFVSACQVSKAIQMFENLDQIGSKCDTESLNVLLQCLCRRSHVGAANSVVNTMRGKIPFSSTTYNVIISGWSKFGRVDEIERILKEMGMDGFSPDCLSFSYLIEGLGRAGRIDDAVEVFDKMKEQGCMADTTTYNAMISNLASIKNFDGCMNYYELMLNNKVEPNVATYKKLISAFLKAKRVADALEMFDEMLSRGIVPTTGTITSFIEPLSSYGPPHAAMMIYKKAREVGCSISLSAYKLLLMRLSRFGKCGMLLNIWDEMQESGYSADKEVYEYVINGLCNNGQLENAVLVMEESLRKGFCPSRLIYGKLNNKLLASNKVEMAYKLFLKIKHARLAENARKFWRANGWHF